MKILWGMGLTDGSGSVGGNTASRNRGGSYMRRKGQPTNPDTIPQQAARAILSAFAQAWRGLTQAQRDAWEAATSNFPFSDRLGQSRLLSGSQLYTKLNSMLASVGQAAITSPPIPSAIPSASVGTVVVDLSGPTYTAVYTPPGAGFTTQLWATPPVSPGINYVKNLYKQIDAVAGTTVSPIDFESAYNAVFGVPPLGTKIFVKAVVVQNASGLSSAGSTSSTIVV